MWRGLALATLALYWAVPAQSAYRATPQPPVALTDGASIAVDASLGEVFTLTIAGTSHTISNPTNLPATGYLNFIITQNATGGFTPLWDTEYTFPYGSPLINSGAGQVTVVTCATVSMTSLVCQSNGVSGVTNVYTSNTTAPTAKNLYTTSSRLSILSPRAQLLKSLH